MPQLWHCLLPDSVTGESDFSEPLLGGHPVACHPEPSEAEDIKKRWQEYTEELYEKDLHDPDNHDGVITHHKQSDHYKQIQGRGWNSS